MGKEKYNSLIQTFNDYGYQADVVEFPGFGKNPALNEIWHLIDYVKFVQKFLKRKNITKAIFIGHSFGGRVALRLLSQNPKYAAVLILSGVPGYLPVSRIKLTTSLIIAKAGGRFFSLPLLNKIKNHVRKFFLIRIGAKDYYNTNGYIRESFKNIIKEPLINYMKKIRLPTFLIWGAEDKIVTTKIARKMQQTILNSELIIVPDERHMFMCQKPDLFVEKINGFLKKSDI